MASAQWMQYEEGLASLLVLSERPGACRRWSPSLAYPSPMPPSACAWVSAAWRSSVVQRLAASRRLAVPLASTTERWPRMAVSHAPRVLVGCPARALRSVSRCSMLEASLVASVEEVAWSVALPEA